MNEQERLADIFYQDAQMERLMESIRTMEQALVGLAEKAGVAGMDVEDATKKAKQGAQSTKEALEALGAKIDESAEKLMDLSDVEVSRAQVFRSIMQDLGGEFKKLGEVLGVTGKDLMRFAQNLQNSPEFAIRNLLGQIPGGFGVFAQMLLESVINRARYDAAGGRIISQFARVEGLDISAERGNREGLGRQIQRLESSGFATEAEISATYKGVLDAGLKIKDARKEMQGALTEYGNEAAMVALNIDKAYAVAGGTISRSAGIISRQLGGAFDENVKSLGMLGAAARQLGQNFDTVLASVMQVTGALRVQGGDLNGVTNAYIKMAEATKSMAPEAGEARQQELGAMAFGDFGKIGSMSTALKGFIVKDVANLMGVETEGRNIMGLINSLSMGFATERGVNKDINLQGAMISVLWDKIRASNMDDKITIVNQLLGTGTHFATALAEMAKTTGGLEGLMHMGSDTQKRLVDAMEKDKKEAVGLANLSNNTFNVMMESIKQVMLSISEATITLLRSLVRITAGGFAALTQLDPGGFTEVMAGEFKENKEAFGRIGTNLKKLLGKNEDQNVRGLGDVLTDFAAPDKYRVFHESRHGYTPGERPKSLEQLLEMTGPSISPFEPITGAFWKMVARWGDTLSRSIADAVPGFKISVEADKSISATTVPASP